MDSFFDVIISCLLEPYGTLPPLHQSLLRSQQPQTTTPDVSDNTDQPDVILSYLKVATGGRGGDRNFNVTSKRSANDVNDDTSDDVSDRSGGDDQSPLCSIDQLKHCDNSTFNDCKCLSAVAVIVVHTPPSSSTIYCVMCGKLIMLAYIRRLWVLTRTVSSAVSSGDQRPLPPGCVLSRLQQCQLLGVDGIYKMYPLYQQLNKHLLRDPRLQ